MSVRQINQSGKFAKHYRKFDPEIMTDSLPGYKLLNNYLHGLIVARALHQICYFKTQFNNIFVCISALEADELNAGLMRLGYAKIADGKICPKKRRRSSYHAKTARGALDENRVSTIQDFMRYYIFCAKFGD